VAAEVLLNVGAMRAGFLASCSLTASF